MFRCIGCDREIGWDGNGAFSYTCPCGSRVFYHKLTEQLALPASLVLALHEGRELPHLDGLVGTSNFTSVLKERFIAELQGKGAIWMEDCEQCQNDGTLERSRAREKWLATQEAERVLGEQ